MRKFISFSGGVESSAMCVLFGNKADAIFADTGFEHKVMYTRLPKVEEFVQKFHKNSFKIHIAKSKKGRLQDYIRDSKYYPSFQQRFCTRIFKIDPIDDFLRQYEDEGAEIMIGLNSDEQDLREGNHGLLPFVKYSYPLVDNGINREMCKEILHSAGLYPKFPPYMKRGGCVGCYYKSKKEYEAMALLSEDEFDEVAELERDIQDNRNKYFSILKEIPRLSEFKKHAQSTLFNPDEIYPVVNDSTKCGVFCNR